MVLRVAALRSRRNFGEESPSRVIFLGTANGVSGVRVIGVKGQCEENMYLLFFNGSPNEIQRQVMLSRPLVAMPKDGKPPEAERSVAQRRDTKHEYLQCAPMLRLMNLRF